MAKALLRAEGPVVAGDLVEMAFGGYSYGVRAALRPSHKVIGVAMTNPDSAGYVSVMLGEELDGELWKDSVIGHFRRGDGKVCAVMSKRKLEPRQREGDRKLFKRGWLYIFACRGTEERKREGQGVTDAPVSCMACIAAL